MKFIAITIVSLLVFTGCSLKFLDYKKVYVEIPQHPWEVGNDIKLWYSLKWNDNGKIETFYVDTDTRKVEIKIPRNCTVYICAYPLGEMAPFGSAVSPSDSKREVVLNQNEGFVSHLLINSELAAAEHVNYKKLISVIETKTDDFRNIDDASVVAEVLNGRLDKSSVETRNKFSIEPITIPNGRWIGECFFDGVLDVTDNRTGELELVPGVVRYYCPELDREFRIALDIDGSLFYSIRYGMIGL